MDSVKITISPEDWGNLVTKYPAYAKRLKIGDFTAGTKNIDTDVKGVITKRKGSVLYNPTPLTDPLKDQYEAIFTDGTRHLLVVEGGRLSYSTGDNLFTLVTAGYSPLGNFEFATTQNRIYFGNGIDSPQVYDRTTTYGGVSYTAPQTKVMGAQAPSSAPTFGADTAGGSVPVGAHTYKITYLYYDSEESNGGPATGVHTVSNPNNTVNLTAIPTGGYGVTARHIYRDDNDGNYVRVGSLLDNTGTTFSDTSAAGTFPIPVDHFTPPNFSMITLWLDRLWVSRVSGDPYTLFFSDPGFPDIYPDTNFILCNQQDPIEATIVYFDRLVVFNKKSMGQIVGNTKDTFRYADIQGSVGCVDNRSIQIRVVNGVPVIVWLSDRGFYTYDGNSINYLSDPIEDQVNFNIQQASQKKNKNVQSTQSDFQGGTSSDGIDLLSIPGSITTINPERVFDDQGDWESGVNTNTSLFDGSNTVKVPTKFTPTLEDGQLNNLVIDGTTLKIVTVADFTGKSIPTTNINTFISSPQTAFAYQLLTPARAGTLTSLSLVNVSGAGSISVQLTVWSDLGNSPFAILGSSATIPLTYISGVHGQLVTGSLSVSLAANTKYWIGVRRISGSNSINGVRLFNDTFNGTVPANNALTTDGKCFNGSTWSNPAFTVPDSQTATFTDSYSFCQSAVIQNGQWTSPIHDTFSDSITSTLSIQHTGNYTSVTNCSGTSSTSASTILEGSDSDTFDIGEDPSPITESIANINGTSNYTLFGKRYWRIRISLTTNDDRGTPIVGTPTLRFNIVAIWISPTIDATTDVTDFSALNVISTVPVGTTLVIEVETSNDDITYPDGFVPFGTEVTRQYIKIRATLTADIDDAVSPILTSLTLQWELTSNLVSSVIDTGVAPPAGWDIFQATFILNGGTVQFEMRSSSTLTDIAASGEVTVFDYTMLTGAILTVDGTPLTEGIDWTAAVSNDATADSLASAINALSTVNAANPPANVITVVAATAGSSGNSITLVTSDSTNLPVSGPTLTGGTDSLANSTFFTVTSGTFPSAVPVFQFVQWRVTITSSADSLPKIDDVTVSWFISLTNSLRVASLFYNGRYYLSASEFSQDVNNILFILDLDGKWRVYKELNIATFSYFLNLPYWGSALEGSIFRFLEGTTDNGTAITLDIRTKAFDYSTGYKDNSDMVKIPIDLTLQGKNTGATFEISYSIDEGQTFNLMALNSGATTFTSSVAGNNFYAYFRATQDISSGRTVIYRIFSNDSNEAELHSVKVSALLRTQIPVITG